MSVKRFQNTDCFSPNEKPSLFDLKSCEQNSGVCVIVLASVDYIEKLDASAEQSRKSNDSEGQTGCFHHRRYKRIEYGLRRQGAVCCVKREALWICTTRLRLSKLSLIGH